MAAVTVRFRVLDGWRGLCALLVAWFHLDALGHFYRWGLIRNSFMFVDFFFVLSGFVMAHAYADELAQRRGFAQFVTRRLGRLWPLHLATLAVVIALETIKWSMTRMGHVPNVEPFTRGTKLPAILTNVLLLNAFGIHDRDTWNGPSWSIGAEFYTYLVFAACCWLARRRLPWLSVLLAACGAAVVISRSHAYIDTTYDYGFFRCLYGFFCGVIVYRAVRMTQAARRVLPQSSVIEFACLALVFAFVSRTGGQRASYAAPLVFSLVVFVFAFEGGFVSRTMRLPAFQKLGAWSYSIYMVHAPILIALRPLIKAAEQLGHTSLRTQAEDAGGKTIELYFVGNQYGTDLFAIGFLMLVIGVAALSYRLIEEPGRRWFYRYANRWG
jgi:hypothetical protein